MLEFVDESVDWLDWFLFDPLGFQYISKVKLRECEDTTDLFFHFFPLYIYIYKTLLFYFLIYMSFLFGASSFIKVEGGIEVPLWISRLYCS